MNHVYWGKKEDIKMLKKLLSSNKNKRKELEKKIGETNNKRKIDKLKNEILKSEDHANYIELALEMISND